MISYCATAYINKHYAFINKVNYKQKIIKNNDKN